MKLSKLQSFKEYVGKYKYFIAANPCLAQYDTIDWEWVVCMSLSWPDVFKWECDQISAVLISSNGYQFWQASFKHFEDSLTVKLVIETMLQIEKYFFCILLKILSVESELFSSLITCWGSPGEPSPWQLFYFDLVFLKPLKLYLKYTIRYMEPNIFHGMKLFDQKMKTEIIFIQHACQPNVVRSIPKWVR